jgi:hypothetical protein
MKMFSRVAIAMVGTMVGATGVVTAQPKAADPKMPPKVQPALPAAKTEPAMADPKAGGMSEKPPAELTDMAKATAGTWRCKGQGLDMHTSKMAEMTGAMTIKLDVDSWWLHGSFASRMGKDSFHFESFTTFDPATKKWRRVLVETGGAWSSGESAGMKDGKVEWELGMHSAMGDAMFRDREDMTDPKVGVKQSGEISTDKGKTWMKVYEMACKK